ncbi:MAG: FAD-dependent oxidoreductase [Campylobacteraceae bacterium]|jgi:malate dehydrogenase (quinone)|nr:FAD-dependent oxidoreductase [Campylobacteraceae bacterium]MBT3882102.1 FAD-dependent oxidoreductase [Campylobacteraceae bacterium]MBT4030117.1 FAD-dependent oxidoreductase [Campylobacteraceae bacterium]MBT4178809.1 FAD-dependent oxidoreductase [Campylobacteraceae bacterium]MBT4572038.1 FAD-dependent oxidoreductase [Campylobacteraceae bacterium]
MKIETYDLLIVGGGVSGSALFYELSEYTNIQKICLLEKYDDISMLNSNATANSQTIHCGDIETNYTLEKAKKVKKTAKMVENYCLQHGYEEQFMFKHQKMAIGIGYKECRFMIKRYEEFKELYPYLEVYDKQTLEKIEPSLILDKNGNGRDEEIIGVGTSSQYTTVNFKALSDSFIENAQKNKDLVTDLFFNSKVDTIENDNGIYTVTTKDKKSYKAKMVIVNAGAHSLHIAHKMGYGLNYGQLPVAGSFYKSSRRILNGKVYMVQNPKLPFAALHGDPDVVLNENTRFGPTALVLPKLERFRSGTFLDFVSTLRLNINVIRIFKDLLSDSDIRNYILRNFIFEIPYFGKKMFLKDARKIIPSLEMSDIEYASGFGGVRAQILDKENEKLMLGEASINTNNGIVFNMTPSPGATSCLGNGLRDMKIICEYLKLDFDEEKFNKDLLKD